MTIPNHITLDALRQMPIGDIVALPAEQLALLHEEADAALKAAKTLKDWLDGAIGLRYGERASQARIAMAKDTGTVRFADGAVTVVADLPKKVEWDQAKLAALVETIRAEGDKQQLARAEEEMQAERLRAELAEKKATRVMKRAQRGVCPCCNRTFQNLAQHMKSKHADVNA